MIVHVAAPTEEETSTPTSRSIGPRAHRGETLNLLEHGREAALEGRPPTTATEKLGGEGSELLLQKKKKKKNYYQRHVV